MMEKRIVTLFTSPRLRFVVLVVVLIIMAACGKDDPPTGPGSGGENAVGNNLSFMRQDGTDLVMGTDYAICCGVWEEGYIDKNTLKILLYDPLLLSDPENMDSFWKLFIIVDEVTLGSAYSFPTANDGPVKVFLVDVVTNNELNGDADDSVGTITIDSLDCGPPLSVSLTIDATIGSEYLHGPTVQISGSFSATVHSNPSPLGCDFAM